MKENSKATGNELSILDVFLTILDYKNKIVAIVFLTTIFTIIYVQFIAQEQYVSEAKIVSSSNSIKTNSQALALANQFGLNISNNDGDVNWVYPDIIKIIPKIKKINEIEFIYNI